LFPPSFASVVLEFVFLDPDAGVGKEVGAIGMVPVNVRDDDVGDLGGFETERREGSGRFNEVGNLEALEELRVVEAAVHQYVVAVAAEEPESRGDVEVARVVRAGFFAEVCTGRASQIVTAKRLKLIDARERTITIESGFW